MGLSSVLKGVMRPLPLRRQLSGTRKMPVRSSYADDHDHHWRVGRRCMAGATNRAPVIVIGMHRSGTSMVVRLLEQMGLFAGWRKEGNNEAFLFLRLNEWLLGLSGGRWDHPSPFRYVLDDEETRNAAAAVLRMLLRSPRFADFLGPGRYLRYRNPWALPFAWGWKDPRNTYTLPIWLSLFPDANVIHVCRHGVDVAQSLMTRQQRSWNGSSRRLGFYALRGVAGRRPGKFPGSPRCSTIQGGLSLWNEYMAKAQMHVHHLQGRAITIRYEDILCEPLAQLARLADFCELPISRDGLIEAGRNVNAKRAFAYRRDPSLVTIARDEIGLLAAHGY